MRASCLTFCESRRREISLEKKPLRSQGVASKRPDTASGCGGALATPPHTLLQQPARDVTSEETRAALARFYDAFARRDGEAVAAMYAADATFEDPVFRLKGEEIGRMWIGLLGRARDFSIAYTIGQAGR